MGENYSLEQLYQQAKAENGGLVVYAGGDAPSQAGIYTTGFSKRFPAIEIRVTVDLSKYHNARIDQQHLRGDVRADVVHLQTLQDFPHWKAQGWLQPFKAAGFESLPADLRDPDGYYYPILAYGFSNVVDTAQIPEAHAPREATDYLRPDLKDRIVLTYPHDDDAVLYHFEQIIKRHGWTWLDGLLKQNPQWVRGTQTPLEIVSAGKKAATFTSFYYLKPEAGSTIRFILPREDFFQSWYQTAAILKAARHPAAARLYISYLLSEEAQNAAPQWPSRLDVAPVPGWKRPLEYINTSPVGFREFMADRGRVERLKGIFEQWIGPVTGDNPTGVPITAFDQ
jgi:ABC-type Fe3+ transport system substrate-binding protein